MSWGVGLESEGLGLELGLVTEIRMFTVDVKKHNATKAKT